MCSRGSHVLWAGDFKVLGVGQTSCLHNLAGRMLRIGCGRGGRGGGGMCGSWLPDVLWATDNAVLGVKQTSCLHNLAGRMLCRVGEGGVSGCDGLPAVL